MLLFRAPFLFPNLSSFIPLSAHNVPIDGASHTCNGSMSNSIGNDFQSFCFHLKSSRPLKLGCFNEYTLMQICQQACSMLTMDSLAIDIYCSISQITKHKSYQDISCAYQETNKHSLPVSVVRE